MGAARGGESCFLNHIGLYIPTSFTNSLITLPSTASSCWEQTARTDLQPWRLKQKIIIKNDTKSCIFDYFGCKTSEASMATGLALPARQLF